MASHPKWKQGGLPGVNPEDLQPGIDTGSGSAPPAGSAPGPVKGQSGVAGFSPQLGGQGKANTSHTSSFDEGPPDYTLPGYPTSKETAPAGQEEGGRMRQPTTSIAGRIQKKKE